MGQPKSYHLAHNNQIRQVSVTDLFTIQSAQISSWNTTSSWSCDVDFAVGWNKERGIFCATDLLAKVNN